jgi:hypothetical protein
MRRRRDARAERDLLARTLDMLILNGRKQLTTESGRWKTLTEAVARAMRPSRAKT